LLGDPELEPGRVALAPGFPVATTIDLPADWASCNNTPLEQAVCGPMNGPEDALELTLMYLENVVADPCADVGLSPPAGPAVDDLVTAIRSLKGFTSTDPVDISVDGRSAKEFVITAPTAPLCESLFTWSNRSRTNGMSPGENNLVRIVDVDGTPILLAIAWQPGQDASVPAARAILDSVRFP
jgi:hypothetical protein